MPMTMDSLVKLTCLCICQLQWVVYKHSTIADFVDKLYCLALGTATTNPSTLGVDSYVGNAGVTISAMLYLVTIA